MAAPGRAGSAPLAATAGSGGGSLTATGAVACDAARSGRWGWSVICDQLAPVWARARRHSGYLAGGNDATATRPAQADLCRFGSSRSGGSLGVRGLAQQVGVDQLVQVAVQHRLG